MKPVISRYKKIVGEFSQVGIGQAMATLGGLVGVRLLTQYMTPISYGELSLGMTFLTLIQQLITGPMANGIARFFSIAQEKQSMQEYIQSVFSLLAKSGILTSAIFLCSFVGLVLTKNQVWVGLLIFSFLFALVSNVNIVLENLYNAARKRVIVAWHQGLSQWLRFLGAITLILVFGSNSQNAMAGYLIAGILIIFSQWYFFRKLFVAPKKTFIFESVNKGFSGWETQIIRFSLPFSIWGIFTWIQMSSDRWALQSFQSTSSVGLYTVLYQVGYYPIILLNTVLVQYITPVLYGRVGDGMDTHKVRSTQSITNQVAFFSIIFSLIFVVLTYVLADWIVALFVAVEFRSLSYLLPGMVLAGGVFASGQICALTALNNNQPQILLIPKIITSILGALFNYLGAYFAGVEGVVVGNILFSAIYFLWVYLLLYPSRKQKGVITII